VNWVLVKSKMLAAVAYVAYNDRWQQLYLKFRSGDIYCYKGVPVEQYRELLAANSKGKYVRSHILNSYPYQRIHSAVVTAS
jgi:KTSC domain